MKTDEKWFARQWYGTMPIQTLAELCGWGESRVRVYAVIELGLGPRTPSIRDQLAKAHPDYRVEDRRKEFGL